jgi:hypothetical protein
MPMWLRSTIEVRRGQMSSEQASVAGAQAPVVFAGEGYARDHFMTFDYAGAGNASLDLPFGVAASRWQLDWQRDYLRSVQDWPHTAAIGALLLEQSYKKRAGRWPLSVVSLHTNVPGTAFAPHYDRYPGVIRSLALSPGLLRCHNDAHEVVEEIELDPGDEVQFVNPLDEHARSIHSFAALDDCPRSALVTKYRSKRHEKRRRGLDTERLDRLAFAPRQ